MANGPIDLIPCKGPLALSSFYSSKGSSEEELDYSGLGQFKPHFNENSSNSSNTLLINFFQEQGGNLSFSSNYTNFSSVPFSRTVPLYPPDTLITSPIYLTLTVASFLGNLAMLGVLLLTPQFRKPANYLIVNLSLSSLLFLVSVNLRMIENAYYTWSYDTVRCRLLAVIHRIPIPCLSLTTMMISVDRGRVARNPMNCSSTVTPKWKSVFIWSFSLIIVIPLAFTREYDECIPLAYKCAKVVLFGNPSYSMLYGIAYVISVHILPGVILIREAVKTKKIMKFLKLSNIEHMHQQLKTSGNAPLPKNTFPDNRLRLLRNSCWFTTVFLVCWLPYGVFQFLLDLPKEVLPEILEIYVHLYFRFVRNLTYLLIAFNPVILFALSYDLRLYISRMKCSFHRHDHLDHAIRISHYHP